jgi:hypothetical protein
MGKEGGAMIRKCLSLGILVSFIFLISGCSTVKGAAQGAAEGAKQDWQALKKADAWFRENLW